MKPRKTMKSLRKNDLVAAAAELFLARGIDDVKMPEIAQNAEVGVATIYRWFGTKADLVVAAGTYLWRLVHERYASQFNQQTFQDYTGFLQIQSLLELFLDLYWNYPSFLKFVYEFDHFVLRENIAPEMLTEYEESILDIYPFAKRAYEKGISDGTLKSDFELRTIYYSVSHALLYIGEKFTIGKILAGDDHDFAAEELRTIIDMTLYRIKA